MVFALETATLAPELQVSMGRSPHLLFCMQNSAFRTRITSLYGSQTSPMVFAFKTAPLAPELQVSMGLSLHLWFCAFKRASFASEILVSLGPSPPLWLLHAKQRL